MTKKGTSAMTWVGRNTKYIPVITRGYSRKIPLEDVIYIEQVNRKLVVATEVGTFASYERLENFEALLDWRFYHALKKLIVNIEKITIAQNQVITFVNGDERVLGRENFIRTKQQYNAYLRNLVKKQELVTKDLNKAQTELKNTGEKKPMLAVEKVNMLELAKGKAILRKEMVDNDKIREEERTNYIELLKKADKVAE